MNDSKGKDRLTGSEAVFRSEAALINAISGLLSRMPGTREVQIVHGPQEVGKDIVFYTEGPLGEKLLSACVVKNARLTGGVAISSSAQSLLHQAEQALNSPYIDGNGNTLQIARVYIMSPYSVSPATMESIREGLLARHGQVTFITGGALTDLFKTHWPDVLALGASGDLLFGDEPCRLLILYSKRDERYLRELNQHLAVLERTRAVSICPL